MIQNSSLISNLVVIPVNLGEGVHQMGAEMRINALRPEFSNAGPVLRPVGVVANPNIVTRSGERSAQAQ